MTGHIAFNEPGSSLASRTRAVVRVPISLVVPCLLVGGDWLLT
jgi:6-phosphogluconolactonase/glucosamine-6-phosphate isomerase/deaminase